MKAVAGKLLIALLGVAVSGAAMASDNECYDAKVRAKPIAQVPTIYPRDPDRIVISWPWFLDLEVKRVLEGDVQQSEITVLAVLHSAYVDKTRTWLLRRNTLGTFNVLRVEDPDAVPRCAVEVGAARPYIQPTDGKSLADYRREGEDELKRYYDDETQ